ncbi:IS5 family transposase [Streptomyces sp. NBC_00101]|uniref:IS5 family transposase n=1 Tax=Streptomyces sp. NBC_00101 TaxID=2975651 RepID=UPI0038701841
MRRRELSHAEWEFIRPLLPRSERGRKRLDDRTVLNGIVWKFRTGTAWRDVPERYGSWARLHTRFRRWARDGTFERMLREAQAQADAARGIDWLVSVDSTVVRAHQHAAGARKEGFEARYSAAPEGDCPARFIWSAMPSAERSPPFSPAGTPTPAPSSPP